MSSLHTPGREKYREREEGDKVRGGGAEGVERAEERGRGCEGWREERGGGDTGRGQEGGRRRNKS